MPTPFFTFRLSRPSQEALRETAKLMATNSSALVREIVETALSGDARRIAEFNTRLLLKVGEQLELRFNKAQDRAASRRKPAKKALKLTRGPRTGGKRNART